MDKMKIAFILILNLLIIIGTTCFAATGIVNAPNGLVLRKEAAKGSDPIATISDKAKVEVVEQNGEWYKVKYNDNEGYLFSEYVDVEEEKAEEEETEKENEVLAKQEEQKEEKQEEKKVEENTSKNEESTYPRKQKVKENTKIYLMPSVTARSIGNIEKDKEITINYEAGNWLNITFGNINGWARKYFVIGETQTAEQKEENNEAEKQEEQKDEQEEQAEDKQESTELEEKSIENKKAYVDVSSSANIRKDASTSAEIVNTLLRNTEVTLVGEKGDFYKIEYQNITGYISKSLISEKPVETVTSRSNSGERKAQNNESTTKQESTSVNASSNASGGSDVVSYAKKYIGYSYVSGGTKPSTGFDCSGFTYYVFNSCGYSLSRSCQVQARSGEAVSRSNLQPGDLVFFNNTSDGGIGHVAIYIGGGRIVHAENSRTGVKTDTIDSGYYNKYYYSARRIAK